MQKKERLVVYPYSTEFTPILRYKELLKDYELVGLVSPNGWGINGMDAGCIDGGEILGLMVSNDFYSSINQCETILFTEYDNESLDFQKIVLPKINEAIENRKNIIVTLELSPDLVRVLSENCKKKGVKFSYYRDKQQFDFPEVMLVHIVDIRTPIVFVIGTSESTNKFDIQLALRQRFISEGYKVCSIGSRRYCELFGFHSFPDFMLKNTMSESKKVILFNRYVKSLETEEKPDLIIIGIPGAIMPYNKEFTNKFGILAYEVSMAVHPDAVVLSSSYGEFKKDYFNDLSNSCKYKFGYEIDCFNLSNMLFDTIDTREVKPTSKMVFTTIASKNVSTFISTYEGLEKPVFNIQDKSQAENMAQYIIDKLADYGQVQSL